MTYGASMCRVIPGPQENLIPPQVGQDYLFEAIKTELGHADLTRNFSLMQWNLEVQTYMKLFLL